MEGEATGEIGADVGTPDQGVNDLTTVYNGSVPCQGCGSMLNPVSVMYSGNTKECHNCRRRRHHRHIKRGMHNGR